MVPTLNRGPYLADALSDLAAQTHRPLEILVVDQSEQMVPEVEAVVRAHPGLITYHKVGFRGLPQARNYGWQHARYNVIIYIDDDIRCSPDFVAEHLNILNRPDVHMVAGAIMHPSKVVPPVRGRKGKFNWWTSTTQFVFNAEGEFEVDHVGGGNFSIRREVIKRLGGIDERLNVGGALYEELEFCVRARRAGLKIMFNGKAKLDHLAAGSGGCRVPQLSSFLYGICHNRAIIIYRHLRWYRRPLAAGRVLLTCLSYCRLHKQFSPMADAFRGLLLGRQSGKMPVLCSRYETGEVLSQRIEPRTGGDGKGVSP